MTIGATIRRLREARGMNQADLAEAINRRRGGGASRHWNQPLISQVEIGRTKSPSTATLEDIAAGLGMSVSDLYLAYEAARIEQAAAPAAALVPVGPGGRGTGPGCRAVADIVRRVVAAHPEVIPILAGLEEDNDPDTYEAAIVALAEMAAADIALAVRLGLVPADDRRRG